MSALSGGWCNGCEKYACTCGRVHPAPALSEQDKAFEEAILKLHKGTND